jgi:hypothetical protein
VAVKPRERDLARVVRRIAMGLPPELEEEAQQQQVAVQPGHPAQAQQSQPAQAVAARERPDELREAASSLSKYTRPVETRYATATYSPVDVEEALRAGDDFSRTVDALRRYGGVLIIFREEPTEEMHRLFERMLVNISINSGGLCIGGGGYRWYDSLKAPAWSVIIPVVSETKKQECVNHVIAAATTAYGGRIHQIITY